MNRKLLRVRDEIDKTEVKIAEWQGHLASLHEQRVQLEEKEIVRGMRAMNLTSRELAAAVDGLCAGKLTLAAVLEADGSGLENGASGQGADVIPDGVSMPEVSGTGGETAENI